MKFKLPNITSISAGFLRLLQISVRALSECILGIR